MINYAIFRGCTRGISENPVPHCENSNDCKSKNDGGTGNGCGEVLNSALRTINNPGSWSNGQWDASNAEQELLTVSLSNSDYGGVIIILNKTIETLYWIYI